MNLYGHIHFADSATNLTDRVIIHCFNGGKQLEQSHDKPCTEYVFNKISKKLIWREMNEQVYLSYTKAVELLDEAINLDKKNFHTIEAVFAYDDKQKPVVRVSRIVKEVFPLPAKTITYLPVQTYINVTKHICGDCVVSNLIASVYADHLNNVAVRSGFLADRMFEYSCGRLFMLADVFMRSNEGRHFIENIFGDTYKTICSCCNAKLAAFRLPKRHKPAVTTDNETYSNTFLRAHCLVAKQLSEQEVTDVIANPELVRQLIQKQLQIYDYEFQKDYYKNIVEKPSDYWYLGINDLLRLHVDTDFRININKHIADIRKIYNANKDRDDFGCIMSDGGIICKS